MHSAVKTRKGKGVKQTGRYRIATAGLAIGILIFTANGYGAVASQQSSTASTESEWQQLGETFSASTETAPVVIEGDVFVLPSSGVELVIGPSFESDAPAEGEVEDQIIVTTPDLVGAVAVIANVGTPSTTYEAYLGGFSESMESVDLVDLQEDDGTVIAVHRVVNGGLTSYMVISVDAFAVSGHHLIEVVIVDADGVGDALELMNSGITIDGVPMFATLDAAAIVEIVEQDAQ